MTRIQRESKTVSHMIQLWCRNKHHTKDGLCPECEELLAYAQKRLGACKFGENKTKGHLCPIHCYKPEMRAKIQQVMRYSGPRMIFHHPIEAIRSLLS